MIGELGGPIGMPTASALNAAASATPATAPAAGVIIVSSSSGGAGSSSTGPNTATANTHHYQQQQQQQQQQQHQQQHQHQQQQQQQHKHLQQQQQQQYHQLTNNMSMLNVKGGGRYLWTDRELLMHLQNYTPLILLIDFVEKTRTKRFYESSERYEILMLVFIMRKGAPFCENKRFPAEYWVNLSVGPVAEAFDRLQAAIDIPDPQLPIHMSVTDLTTWKEMFDGAMIDIRRFAYYTDPMQLADVGVYNRITFEQRFAMQWQE
ncbi:high mobility group protein DSP1 [Drosophila mojavensis]|uniref:Uncharacterized protein n=1 Tax=Drosophila mojavensis TaxID=7230 RepID=B4L6L4_DROMO|nr:high mobility group protein DSP1 [Drosophila mojavensis]EDW06010.1 uncharacterized protein Dmoj_GI16390 [Drosophila mojavensis]